jgi:hypothetical protein
MESPHEAKAQYVRPSKDQSTKEMLQTRLLPAVTRGLMPGLVQKICGDASQRKMPDPDLASIVTPSAAGADYWTFRRG